MDCLFRADLKKVQIPFLRKIPVKDNTTVIYFAHSVVSDLTTQKSYKEVQNVSMISRDSFKRPLMFANYIDPFIIRGFANYEIAETSPFNFHLKTENLDLQMNSQKAPLMEGGKGYISVCGRESYYYSLTDLKVRGTLSIGDKLIDVEGQAWMDHQWADCAYKKDKWSWFALQLKDHTEIMCVEYDDGKNREYLVDIIYPDGRQEHLNKLLLRPGKETWTSKETKSEYPMTWEIEIPEKKMSFRVKSLLRDQEMIFGAINYWEGPTEITGEIAGKPVKGFGFMELVGFASDYHYLNLLGKKVNKEILKRLQASRKWIIKKVSGR
jgi:predicted secreted hydrolase